MWKKLPVDGAQVAKWEDSDWEAGQKQGSRKADGNDREQCREDAEELDGHQVASNQAECPLNAHQCEREQRCQQDKLQIIRNSIFLNAKSNLLGKRVQTAKAIAEDPKTAWKLDEYECFDGITVGNAQQRDHHDEDDIK